MVKGAANDGFPSPRSVHIAHGKECNVFRKIVTLLDYVWSIQTSASRPSMHVHIQASS